MSKSGIIKKMMKNAGIDIHCLAEYLGCEDQSLRNKFSRDSFSIDDLVITTYACGYSVYIVSDNEKDVVVMHDANYKRKEAFFIDPKTYFSNSKKEIWERIERLKRCSIIEKTKEYEFLKRRLNELEKELGKTVNKEVE